MNNFFRAGFLFTLALFCCSELFAQRETDFNFNWKFALVSDSSSVAESAERFNDHDWRILDLPHDWVIEGSYDSVKTANTAQATGFIYGGGTGWYRKTFDLTYDPTQTVYVLFDGIYNNSEVWINGKKLGIHYYGYSPFYYDLSDFLHKDGKGNVIAVKVDHTRHADSRWYTGAGIYRNVKLIKAKKLHIPIWGTFVTTPEVSAEKAKVSVAINLVNGFENQRKAEIVTKIYSGSMKLLTEHSDKVKIGGTSDAQLTQEFEIINPSLWKVDEANMYSAVTTVLVGGKVCDEYVTPFGIRSFIFDKDKGFSLNGQSMKIKGVCLHHDVGLVGSAVPKGVWRRRLSILKAGGCNAIRIAHNPGSQEFLDLCDEMGFLVQDEFFDEWDYPKDKRLNQEERHNDYVSRGYTEHFQECAEEDLKTVVRAHRNHPSIIQWSIGNEIEWTYNPRYRNVTGYFNMEWSGNYFWEMPPISPEEIKKRYLESQPVGKYVLAETAKKLADWTRELDTTRPVTANCILPSASHVTGYADALDVVGYSYRRVLYDYGHENYPDKPIMGTENLAQWHEWKAIEDRPFIAGTFLWTGADYMGEIRGNWPIKASTSGMLDLASFTKGSYHMMKTLWTDEPHIYIATQNIEKSINKLNLETGLLEAKNPEKWKTALWTWHNINNHWNYQKGEMISVEVYSNCDQLELFLNGESLGMRKLAEFDDRIYKWAVPFESGELMLKGIKNGIVSQEKLVTAKAPASIKIVSDVTTIDANGYDVVHVVAQLVDQAGNPVKTEERTIKFLVGDKTDVDKSNVYVSTSKNAGNLNKGLKTIIKSVNGKDMVEVLGVDNGAPDNVQDHKSDIIRTSQGKGLMILQSRKRKGVVNIRAVSENLTSNTIEIIIE